MKFLTQAAKVRDEQKKGKRRLAVFLCLAVVVALGTAAALKMYGQAMSHKDKRLICQLEVHQHTDACYDGDKLICGYADYVVHTHNDDCYDGDGNLVCSLPEIAAHTHTDECYTEQEVLLCGEEEGHTHTEECYTPERGELLCQLEEHTHGEECYDPETGELTCQVEEHQHHDSCYEWKEVLTCAYASEGHVHSEECYTPERGELLCQTEEHTHGEECYNEANELICNLEEHTHSDDCYQWENVLTCQLEETQPGHTHTDACYGKEKVLTCGQLELHTHDENCLDENGALVCGLLELKEHTHQEECFEVVELTDEEVAAQLEDENIATVSEDAAESVSGDAIEEEEPAIIKTYEDERYIVTASYHKDAEIPEDAELRAEMITPEMDEAHYAEREAEIRKTLEDESLSMNALFRIGFYKEEQEIEPQSDVTVKVQFLDENGLAEESPVAVIHFADDGSQVLSGGIVKDKATTFKTNGFSEFGIVEGYSVEPDETTEEAADTEESEESAAEGVSVNQTYEYECDAYNITFHVNGKATLAEDKEGESEVSKVISFGDEDVFVDAHDTSESVSEDESDVDSNSDNGLLKNEEAADDNPSTSENETDTEEGPEEAEDIETDENGGLKDWEQGDSAENSDFEFKVEPLEEDSEGHIAVKEYMEEEADKLNAQSEQLMLHTISYSLEYKGKELDLSDCEIEAEITPAETLLEQVKEETGDKKEKTSVAFTVMGVSQDNQVSEVETVSLENNKPVKPLRFSIPSTMKTVGAGANTRTNVDPKFKVEYYAYVKVPVSTNENPNEKPALELINTDNGGNGTGGNLPNNATTKYKETKENGVIKLKMEGNGGVLAANQQYSIAYEEKLMKIFESEEFNFMNYPQLKYVNKFKYKVKGNAENPEKPGEPELNPNPHYDAVQIWVDSAGDSAGQGDDWNGWDKLSYKAEGDLEITNNAAQATGDPNKYILIEEKNGGNVPVIRFVCKYNTKDKNGEEGFDNPVDFYDYDITDGRIYGSKEDAQSKKEENAKNRETEDRPLWMNVNQEGINQKDYGISVGTYDDPGGVRFGFGNGMNNAGPVWDKCRFNNYYINKGNTIDDNGIDMATLKPALRDNPSNRDKAVYGLCSFGIVKNKLDENMKYPVYADGIVGPDLFSPENVAPEEPGKTRVEGYSMNFSRQGDTYILKEIYNSAATGGTASLANLDQFTCTTKDQWTLRIPIYSNNFWPMDFSSTFNADGHDYKFGEKKTLKSIMAVGKAGEGDISNYGSDDGKDHNSFFGMTFAVNFELTKDYCGLLDYYFFGDDDMWVYLVKKPEGDDPGWSKLVCDIGGVHSAVGEYVNLWDWIRKGEVGKDGREGKYALKFFYTERGASGSTCWMQYTLPSASIQPVDQSSEQDELTVKKTVANLSNPKESFGFKITLNAGTGNKYPYVIKDENGTQVGSGSITDKVVKRIELQHNQKITIMHLPKGTQYTVEEEKPRAEAFKKTEYKINSGQLQEGLKTGDQQLQDGVDDIVEYINTASEYELPETGGFGTMLYTIAGVLIVSLGAGFMYRNRRKFAKGGD